MLSQFVIANCGRSKRLSATKNQLPVTTYESLRKYNVLQNIRFIINIVCHISGTSFVTNDDDTIIIVIIINNNNNNNNNVWQTML